MRFGVFDTRLGCLCRLACALTLASGAFLAVAAVSANATKTHLPLETFGSAAQPEFESANALAVDPATGDLLVIDTKADTLSRYNPDGTPADFSALGTNTINAKGAGRCATVPADCDQTPQNGFTFGPFPNEQQVVVDNSGTATDGDIYVTQSLQESGNSVDIFASSGKYLGQLTAAGATKFGAAPLSPCGVAVDGGGNVYVAGGYEDKIYTFDPSANPPVNADNTATFSLSEPTCNLAAGAGPTAGSLFANTAFNTNGNSVLKLDSTSGAVQAIVDPGVDTLISVDSLTGHLYAAGGDVNENNSVIVDKIKEFDASGTSGSLLSVTPASFPSGLAVDGQAGRFYVSSQGSISVYGPLVTVPDVATGGASITGDTSATLSASVNPDGVALEECFFEYGPTADYGQSVPCAESPAEIGTDTKAVHADLSGLAAETRYHYRFAAKNPNTTIRGSDKTFKSPSKPAIEAQWAAEVGIAEATVKAQLNPENSPTTYRFEWGASASYGRSTPEIPIGSGEADRTVGFHLDGLTPGTILHYRVVASNGIGVSEGADHTFTTFPLLSFGSNTCPNAALRTGPSALLPDCRAYEMVSPVDKNGGEIKVLGSTLNFPARLEESSAAGDRFAYSSITAFGDAVSAPWTSEYIATRNEGEGWSTHSINPARETKSLTLTPAFKFDVQYKAFSEDLSSGWLIHDSEPPLDDCAPQGNLNLYHRDNVTGEYEALTIAEPTNIGAGGYELELQGVSSDGAHAVFRANATLTPNAATKGTPQLYEHVEDPEGGCGELRLVSVLPNGKASTTDSSLGTFMGLPGESRENAVVHAVSADGSRAFWSTNPGGTTTLYLRDTEARKTVQIVSGGSGTRFWDAALDGSKALYMAGGGLYEFNTEKALAGEPASTLIAASAKGTAAASDDLSRLFFVSTEALEGEGKAGEPNLYLREAGGETNLVASLYGGGESIHDEGDLNVKFPKFGFALAQPNRIADGVRATADGSHLAFVSAESLTGYDNRDGSDGRRSLELYLYDTDTDHLACISCNPSGARPSGRIFESTNDAEVSLRVSAHMAPAANQFFAPRALSADGNRLFFESFEALLARDTNGKGDVYEWQRASGQAQCDENGAELYVPGAGGCLSLISTGQSPVDSEFADASPDGHDVFIRTSSSLLPQDPGQVDLYDARVGGGLPQPPAPPAACEGEACQGPLAPPNDPTPASAAFEGAGNVKEARAKKKKAKKKHHHKKHHAKHKTRKGK